MNPHLNIIFSHARKGALAMIFLSFIFPLAASRAELSLLGGYDVLDIFNDADANSDFYNLHDEPLMDSPDQVSQGISGLVSDPGTGLWANDECSVDGQPTNDIQKRNDLCPDPGSLNEPGKGSNLDHLEMPSPLDAVKGAIQTVTSDDRAICGTFENFDIGYFAVCDSGLEHDRILNKLTGEYSLLNCERRKLRDSFIFSSPADCPET